MVKGRSVNLLASCGHGHLGHSTLVHGLGTRGSGPRAWLHSEGSPPSGSQTPLVGSGSLQGWPSLTWIPLAPGESLTSDPRRLALYPAARCSGYHTPLQTSKRCPFQQFQCRRPQGLDCIYQLSFASPERTYTNLDRKEAARVAESAEIRADCVWDPGVWPTQSWALCSQQMKG